MIAIIQNNQKKILIKWTSICQNEMFILEIVSR